MGHSGDTLVTPRSQFRSAPERITRGLGDRFELQFRPGIFDKYPDFALDIASIYSQFARRHSVQFAHNWLDSLDKTLRLGSLRLTVASFIEIDDFAKHQAATCGRVAAAYNPQDALTHCLNDTPILCRCVEQ